MKSLKMLGGSRVELTDAAEPVPGAGEVLIATAMSALCGSELRGYRGDGQASGNSGHEAAGVVAAVGEGVDAALVGRRVGVCAVAGCGHCEQCAAGRTTWCTAFRVYTNMHAERFLAAASAVHLLPDDVPWGAGVLLTGDGLGVPYHTSTKIASPEVRTVAILGAGPIGLGGVLVQAHLGRRVIAVDLSAWRLDAARRLGAAETVDASAGDVVAALRELTEGCGPDVCIEAAGRPETALSCFAAVRTGGTVVFNGEQGPLSLSPSDHFIRRDITAVGSWFYHYGEYPAMLALYRDGLRVGDLATHTLPAAAADEAWSLFAAGQAGKVLLDWSA
ncbi:MAG: zinc-binding dehydrogenase [Armatimonadetes bacterium]|nr:zinc-binding dehydrogenase [Armatimonadota bacterium]